MTTIEPRSNLHLILLRDFVAMTPKKDQKLQNRENCSKTTKLDGFRKINKIGRKYREKRRQSKQSLSARFYLCSRIVPVAECFRMVHLSKLLDLQLLFQKPRPRNSHEAWPRPFRSAEPTIDAVLPAKQFLQC